MRTKRGEGRAAPARGATRAAAAVSSVLALLAPLPGVLATPRLALALGLTYHVDVATGDDLRTPAEAQNPATPWKTIATALLHAEGGDTVVVAPGTYRESVETKRDGWSKSAPIALVSAVPGRAIVRPPAGTNAFVVGHDFHTIDGFRIKRAVQGIKLGPHDADGGPVMGVVVRNNRVQDSRSNGIRVTSGDDVEIASNDVRKNGANGISYSGDASLIHDNVVQRNAQFGIYVRDGVDHQVYDNVARRNGTGEDDDVKILGATLPPPPETYHVDCEAGDDTRTPSEAKNPETPWRTIGRGVLHAQPGATVLVEPGTCAESVESKRDGAPGAPIVLRSRVRGKAVVRPPSGSNAFLISHHHHVVEGFKIKKAAQGIRLGPHDVADGPVTGLLVRRNRVVGSTSNGISVVNGVGVEIALNQVKRSGANGISHSGDASLIHDNVVHHNAQFGIYVKDGVDHQVYDNEAYANGTGEDDDVKILGTTAPTPARTYFVDCERGDDGRTPTKAKNRATPWKSIKRALGVADAGATVRVLPGVCSERSIESRRNGRRKAPITIEAETPRTVTIAPPTGNGLLIVHHHHTVRGLVVTGGTNGIQVGPHEVGGGAVNGVVIGDCEVHGNSVTGVKLSKAVKGRVQHSVVHHNGSHGISYSGKAAYVFDNLVYANGCAGPGCGDYGISILAVSGFSNAKHQIINNTIFGNLSGGLRLGDDGGASVSGTVLNNIVVANPIGVKEQGGGRFMIDHNDVFGNSDADYQLAGSTIGAGSLSVYPELVDPANGDFRLSRVAAGQAVDSPCIDAGSATAEALGLGRRSAFTDGSPDEGPVDLGYHGTRVD